jgi:hypothetical protein
MLQKNKLAVRILVLVFVITTLNINLAMAAPPTSVSCPSRAETTRIIVETFDVLMHPNQTEPYIDVNNDDWFYQYIAAAYANSLIFDNNRHRFYPNLRTTGAWLQDVLTRAVENLHDELCPQITKAIAVKTIFLARGVNNQPDFPTSSDCESIDFNSWYGAYLAQGVNEGWLNCASTPQAWEATSSLDRAQFTKYVVSSNDLLNGFTPPGTPTFSDVPADSWLYNYVEAAVYYDLIDPDPNNLYFEPEKATDECFMSRMLSRV